MCRFRDHLPRFVAEDENGLPPQIALQVSESGQLMPANMSREHRCPSSEANAVVLHAVVTHRDP